MSSTLKTVTPPDHEAVLATAQRYVDGVRTGSVEGVASAFHRDAVMYGLADGALAGGPIQALYDFMETHGNAPGLTGHLEVLAITPTTAVVRVDLGNDALGNNYTDYLTLIKIDEAWKVMAKVYHRLEA